MRIIIALVVAAVLMSACSTTFQSKEDYFDGAVLVEYFQIKRADQSDNVTFTFNEPGEYIVTFSYTPDKRVLFNADLPENFTVTVGDSTVSKVVNQYRLPDFLTITIEHNEVMESHDFQ